MDFFPYNHFINIYLKNSFSGEVKDSAIFAFYFLLHKRAKPRVVVVVVFITVTCTANGGHWVPPGGLQAYSLPQPWLCRAPKVRRGGEGDACVSMETCNIKIHNREHRFSNSVPISGP
jgi:hypothetical protein